MPIRGIEQLDAAADRVAQVLRLQPDDLRPIGESAAEGVVAATLAGVADGDKAFAPYSEAYMARLAAAGVAKPRGTVDLRGVLPDDHLAAVPRAAKPPPAKVRKGKAAPLSFAAATHTAPTGPARPSRGLTDPNSEMSLDLIAVGATDAEVTLTYTPRRDGYMIAHQTGNDRLPARKWFTLNRAAVKDRVLTMARAMLNARAAWFNRGGQP